MVSAAFPARGDAPAGGRRPPDFFSRRRAVVVSILSLDEMMKVLELQAKLEPELLANAIPHLYAGRF